MRGNSIDKALDLLNDMDRVFDELCCHLRNQKNDLAGLNDDDLKTWTSVRIREMDALIGEGFMLTAKISKLIDH